MTDAATQSATAKAPATAFERHERTLQYEPNTGCWLSSSAGPQGYAQVCHAGSRYLGHRASWEHHFGVIPAGVWVLHRCDTPACCNPEHLFLGSPADNTADMVRKGRGKVPSRRLGTDVQSAKLTPDLVRAIRAEYRRGVPGRGQIAIGHRFGVNHKTVRRVIDGSTWAHVQ